MRMLFLKGIGIKYARKAPLVSVDSVRVTLEGGMEGDIRGGGGKHRRRQVTVISHNQWHEACSDMGWDPSTTSWMHRRAGLCVEGVWFSKKHIGKHLIIGDSVILLITGETTPCEVMNTIAPGLKDVLAVQGRAGVTCRVLQGGRIASGNTVAIREQFSL